MSIRRYTVTPRAADAQPTVQPSTTAPIEAPPPAGELSAVERAMLGRALQDARFNKSKAAKALGLTRAQLYVRMRRYGLE